MCPTCVLSAALLQARVPPGALRGEKGEAFRKHCMNVAEVPWGELLIVQECPSLTNHKSQMLTLECKEATDACASSAEGARGGAVPS